MTKRSLTVCRRIRYAALLIALVQAGLVAQNGDLEIFRQQALAAHNALRAKHGARPLTLDPELNQLAPEWAQHLAVRGALQHRLNNRFGENLHMASSSRPDFDEQGEAAVQGWYDEGSRYDFKHPGFSMATGHFTQVVWKNSTKLGCGKARPRDGHSVFVVCNYDPPGNFEGQFRNNVELALH